MDSNNNIGFQGLELHGNLGEGADTSEIHNSPSSASKSSITGNTSKKASLGEAGGVNIPKGTEGKRSRFFFSIGGLFCALFTKEDCHKREEITELQAANAEDALFCTLCNAEVLLVAIYFSIYLESGAMLVNCIIFTFHI